MPQITVTWNFSQDKLNTFVPPWVARVNQSFNKNFTVPSNVTELQAFIKDAMKLYAMQDATRHYVSATVPAFEEDLRAEMFSATEED